MIDDVERSEKQGREQIAAAATLDEIRQAETDVLGKKAPINLLKKQLGRLDPEARRAAGQALERGPRHGSRPSSPLAVASSNGQREPNSSKPSGSISPRRPRI